ncbi:hypothetical protein [Pseudanabaena sp. BC1403]|uniref:hypothetical protein n=1 Tax=Pseudanabaena sp. BC1403 TaxID=2043171 RepID=UPI000CD82A5A|nr:hypothetical protein [Pseudanabaena sp. BC1403]
MRNKICRLIRESPLVLKFTVVSNFLFLLIYLRDIGFYFFPNAAFALLLLSAYPIGILYLITLIWSIFYALFQFKKFKYKALISFLIHTAMILLVVNVNFTKVWIKFNFEIFLRDREEVVTLAKSDQLQTNSRNRTVLPSKYVMTSCDGTVDIVHNPNITILFCTFKGIDSVAGFIYSDINIDGKQGSQSPNLDQFSQGKIVDVEKLRDRWFWFSST